MNRNLAIGLIFLFIFSAIVPITFGYNLKILNNKESQQFVFLNPNKIL